MQLHTFRQNSSIMSSSIDPSQVLSNEDDEDSCLEAFQFCNNMAFPMSFKAALELDLFGIISRKGPGAHVSASYIASQLPAQNPEAAASRLDRMLRLFVAHSLLVCSVQTLENGAVERLYGLTRVGKFFAGGPDSLAPVVALSSQKVTVDVWEETKDAILTGGSQFKKVHGVSIFEYMDKDPEFNNIYNQAMAQLTTTIMKKVLEKYKGFEELKSLVDVAGGTGMCLNMIVSKYPSIKGINFDLPHVTRTAPSYPGIEHVGGDMFSVIPKADAFMIKDALHNWSDEHCIKVLKNCYNCLPEKGKMIVINLLMPEVPDATMISKYVSRLDTTMLLQPGGKERTQKEFEALCKGSGFSEFRVACLAHSLWGVMEFNK